MTQFVRIKIVNAPGEKKPPYWLTFLRAVLMFAVLFVPGLIADSAPLQWAGFAVLLFFLVLGALAASSVEWLTVDQARARLDELDRK